jgi:hypothetical protein
LSAHFTHPPTTTHSKGFAEVNIMDTLTKVIVGCEIVFFVWLISSMLLYVGIRGYEDYFSPNPAKGKALATAQQKPLVADATAEQSPIVTHQEQVLQVEEIKGKEPEPDTGVDEFATTVSVIENLTMRQAKAIAQNLRTTDGRIIGYGNKTLTELKSCLRSPKRLPLVASIDITSLEVIVITGKKKKKAKASP